MRPPSAYGRVVTRLGWVRKSRVALEGWGVGRVLRARSWIPGDNQKYPHLIPLMFAPLGYARLMTENSPVLITGYSSSNVATLPGTQARSLVLAWLVEYPSQRTREAYRADLEAFASWLGEQGAGELLEVTRPVVALYARYLGEAAKYSLATQARKLSALSSFYGYAEEVGAIASNPAGRVRRPRIPKDPAGLGLTLDYGPRLLAAADDMTAAHRGLVALSYLCGLRVSEALAVSTQDFREEAGHRVLRVIGKGEKLRLVPLSPQAWRWLEELHDAANPGRPLLRDSEGRPLNRFQARRMVEAMRKKAGLTEPMTTHDLRRSAATGALEAGAPIHRVQEFLGHASPVTTQRYLRHRDVLDNSAAYELGRALSERKAVGE